METEYIESIKRLFEIRVIPKSAVMIVPEKFHDRFREVLADITIPFAESNAILIGLQASMPVIFAEGDAFEEKKHYVMAVDEVYIFLGDSLEVIEAKKVRELLAKNMLDQWKKNWDGEAEKELLI